jgi:hypothetical protein
MSDEWTRHATDPDGRDVVFDVGSHLHLARRQRDTLLDQVDEILQAIETPEFRENDPMPGRERFYRRFDIDAARWLRVVVDFNDAPAWIVTAFVQDSDPRLEQR